MDLYHKYSVVTKCLWEWFIQQVFSNKKLIKRLYIYIGDSHQLLGYQSLTILFRRAYGNRSLLFPTPFSFTAVCICSWSQTEILYNLSPGVCLTTGKQTLLDIQWFRTKLFLNTLIHKNFHPWFYPCCAKILSDLQVQTRASSLGPTIFLSTHYVLRGIKSLWHLQEASSRTSFNDC